MPWRLMTFAMLLACALCAPGWPVLQGAGSGIRSWVAGTGVSTWTPYAQYMVRLATMLAAACVPAFQGHGMRTELRALFPSVPRLPPVLPASPKTPLGWMARTRPVLASLWSSLACHGAALVILGLLIANREIWSYRAVYLPFHEGEWLGLVPILRGIPHPLDHMFLVHGLGVDLLPDIIGGWIAAPGSLISGARDARYLLFVPFVAGLAWIVREIARSAGVQRTGPLVLLCMVILAASYGRLWSFGNGPLFDLPLRRVVFMSQIALAILALRTTCGRTRTGVFGLLGLLVVPGVLWNFGDGTFGIALTAVALSVLVAARGRGAVLAGLCCAVGTVAGAATAAMALPGFLSRTWEMISYWAAVGRDISLERIPSFSLVDPVASPYACPMIVAQGIAAALLLRAVARDGIRRTALARGTDILLLFSAIVYMRVALENGNDNYVGITGLFSALVATNLVARAATNRLQPEGVAAVALAALACLPVLVKPLTLDPFNAVFNVERFVRWHGMSDDRIVGPDTAAALSRIRILLAGQPCTEVLQSTAFWNYATATRSCSRFYVPLFAATPAAQRELVADVEAEKPLYIIHDGPHSDYSSDLDMRERLPLLYLWADERYAPFLEDGGISVWKRKPDQ